MKQRIQYIDRLKGVLIILVVCGHFMEFALKQKPDPIFLNVLDSFHMPMFMFLSGLVITKTPSRNKSFIKTISFLMPVLTIGVLFSLYDHKTIDFLLFDNMKAGYWYLFVLGEFYLFISLFNIKITKERKCFDVLFAIIFFLVIALLNKTTDSTINGLFSFKQCYAYWPWFVLGYFTYKYHLMDWLYKNNWVYTACLILEIPVLYAVLNGHQYLIKLANLCPIIILTFIFRKREKESTFFDNTLSYIGRNTLDIYIYHFFIVVNINLQMVGTWLNTTNNHIIETFFVVLISIIICYISILMGRIIKNSFVLDSVIYGRFITKVLSIL